MVKHNGEFAHLGLGEAILEVVVVGVRADLVEAVHVRVEEESQVLVHVKDFRVLEHVVVVVVEDVDEGAADVGVESGESLFELDFVEHFVIVGVETWELVADESRGEFREEAGLSPVAIGHHLSIHCVASGTVSESSG